MTVADAPDVGPPTAAVMAVYDLCHAFAMEADSSFMSEKWQVKRSQFVFHTAAFILSVSPGFIDHN